MTNIDIVLLFGISFALFGTVLAVKAWLDVWKMEKQDKQAQKQRGSSAV